MTTLINENGYELKFNGGKSYLIVDNTNQCLFVTDTVLKAKNRLNKILKCANLTTI